jgi:branched-chain amino acid transport system substrate-binding protein
MQFTRRDILNAGASLAALAAASAPGRLLAQGAEEIRFGSLTPNTRAGSLFGPGMQRAIEHAVADVNALGGLLGGRKIRLFSEDSQSDPDAGVRAAKKLIEVNKVKTLLGTWSSGVTMAVAPIVMQSQVLNMNCSGTTDLRDMKKDDWIWPVAGSNISYGRMMGEYAVQAGYRKASFLAFNNPSGITLGAEFKKVFEAAGGTCEVIVYNPNQPSYKAELSRALASKPQVIALGSYLPDTTIILKEWYVMDVPVNWVGPIWAVSAGLVSAVGPKASEGIVSIGALPNDQSTAYAAFRDRYEKEMKQEVLTNPFAAMAYDMVAVSALAIESAKSDNPAEFRKHIRKVSSAPGEKVFGLKQALEMVRAGKDIDYEGVGGNMDFDEVGEARPYFGSWKVEGGKLVLKGRIKA